MMGGPGSGGWNRSMLDTIEEHRSLDVAHLHRGGVLEGGQARWNWVDDGPIVDLLVVGHRHELGLRYRLRVGQGDSPSIAATIALCWRPCAFGGERPFLVCPDCSRAVLRLYLADDRFRCRRCHGLAYASQREREHHRALRRARRLRQRLGHAGRAGGIPPRPKGMHQRTYHELTQWIEGLEAAAGDAAALLFLNLTKRLDRKPARNVWP